MHIKTIKIEKMKTKLLLIFAAIAAIAVIIYSCRKDEVVEDELALKAGSPTQTAQSMMVNIEGLGDYITIETGGVHQIWKFDVDCAKTHFSASGGNNDSQREAAIQTTAEHQKCTFWEGGTLEGDKQGQVTVSVVGSTHIDAQTCWYLHKEISDGGGNVDIDLNIIIMGESFMIGKNFNKYSFTLRNPDGSTRISDLRITVNGQSEVLDHQLTDGTDDNKCLGDILYYGNAGYNIAANGASAALKLHTPLISGALPAADTKDILLSDSFNNNNGICGYLTIAEAVYSLNDPEPGIYDITISGVAKGVEGSKNITFEVKSAGGLKITAQGCQ